LHAAGEGIAAILREATFSPSEGTTGPGKNGSVARTAAHWEILARRCNLNTPQASLKIGLNFVGE
jgi:hypothetical protein